MKTDMNLVKGLQDDHGGWNEAMVSVSFLDLASRVKSFSR